MAGDVEFKIEGLDKVLAKLEAVGGTVRRKAGRSALRKAGNIIVKAARLKVSQNDDPDTPQNIAKNIFMQWNNRRFKATGDLAFRIGVRGGAKSRAGSDDFKIGGNRNNPGGDTWYWRFLEFGTKIAIAKPFLRPAMAENVQSVTDTFITALSASIDRATKAGKAE